MATGMDKDGQQKAPDKDAQLTDAELWWKEHYEMLEAHGYRLRPRYRPDWVPSWKSTGKNPLFCEDFIWSVTEHVIDAVRVRDGATVSIKRVKTAAQEPSIALFLSSEESGSTMSSNHCVPILDHFSDTSSPHYTFLVMPLLRRFDSPPFFSVDEAVDFIGQTLEGLTHMHSFGVAHRDCAPANIMFDAAALYPKGFHPVSDDLDPSGTKRAPVRRRRDVKSVKYYFIDFGISSRFDKSVQSEKRRVTGIDGRDRDVPELSAHVPYDPFAVDVFILGNVYRKNFLDKYTNLAFLSNFVDSMTNKFPEDRPSAEQALKQFHDLIRAQSSFHLRWRLRGKDVGLVRRVFQDIGSVSREGLYISKSIISTLSTHILEHR